MQQLIQTEMKVRQRFKATGTHAIANAERSQGEHTIRSVPETSICRTGGGSGSSATTRSPEKQALADDSGSVDGKWVWSGASGGSGGGGESGKKGLRHELRVQMNIERKRARLFEDIQTLPYT